MSDIINEIRKKAKTEEIDYLFLMDCLSNYKRPRDKLSNLLKTKKIIRVKKGIYVFAKEYRKRPYSLEILANLLYGPSYVSFEYALSFYGLIPETTIRITSATLGRNKFFSTSVGEFIYHHHPLKKYIPGVVLKSIDENTNFLIATKEKAIADCIAKLSAFSNKEDLLQYLIESMRIDSKDIFSLDKLLFLEIAKNFKNINVDLLCKILMK
ncbi:MAG: hypothetical protein K1060chlam5_00397 [Candidatus Anoxychlamydiales bacterium]|nr:hypothetical protein [Candidatus Anoxychlamydiales bacterium]